MEELKKGSEVKEGDIVRHTMSIKTGERRVSRKRGYDTYSEYEDKEITGLVEKGEYAIGIGRKLIECLMVKTDVSNSYNTYFWGKVPERVKSNHSEPLFIDKEYRVLGNIKDNPELCVSDFIQKEINKF